MLFDKIGCPIASLIFGGNGTPCIHIIDPYRERLTLRPRATDLMVMDKYQNHGFDNIVIHMRGD